MTNQPDFRKLLEEGRLPWRAIPDGDTFSVEREAYGAERWIAELDEATDAALIVAAVNALPAHLARIAELEAALNRMLLEFDFLVENGSLPDIRGDIIFVQARAALSGGQP